uniref:RRM domain-containing protein n=1 Tax=Timspurckia oligopyrenoides TaxID=708627 RepID=A0A7S0ZJ03_9RHOD|mmetsp:Transcript_7205/g.12985  ORF Transcript_7205/g.12985 Transcript_7205/m.12985 type:complete len:614 (+) Transcript_7205:652-2493(+)
MSSGNVNEEDKIVDRLHEEDSMLKPSKDLIGSRKLFLKNLPDSLTESELRRVLEPFGELDFVFLLNLKVASNLPPTLSSYSSEFESVQHVYDNASSSQTTDSLHVSTHLPCVTKLYAYCEFVKLEAAQRAIHELNNTFKFPSGEVLQMVFVRSYLRSKDSKIQDDQKKVTLETPASVAQAHLDSELTGARKSAYETEFAAADDALMKSESKHDESERMKHSPAGGSDISLSSSGGHVCAEGSGSSSGSSWGGKLFVGQLPKYVTESDLVEIFCEYGTLVDVKVLRARGVSRGCGFVRFSEDCEAMEAVEALCGAAVFGDSKELPLNVRFADSPQEKTLRKQVKHQEKQRRQFHNNQTVSPIPTQTATAHTEMLFPQSPALPHPPIAQEFLSTSPNPNAPNPSPSSSNSMHHQPHNAYFRPQHVQLPHYYGNRAAGAVPYFVAGSGGNASSENAGVAWMGSVPPGPEAAVMMNPAAQQYQNMIMYVPMAAPGGGVIYYPMPPSASAYYGYPQDGMYAQQNAYPLQSYAPSATANPRFQPSSHFRGEMDKENQGRRSTAANTMAAPSTAEGDAKLSSKKEASAVSGTEQPDEVQLLTSKVDNVALLEEGNGFPKE